MSATPGCNDTQAIERSRRPSQAPLCRMPWQWAAWHKTGHGELEGELAQVAPLRPIHVHRWWPAGLRCPRQSRWWPAGGFPPYKDFNHTDTAGMDSSVIHRDYTDTRHGLPPRATRRRRRRAGNRNRRSRRRQLRREQHITAIPTMTNSTFTTIETNVPLGNDYNITTTT